MLLEVIEHHEHITCVSALSDTLLMEVGWEVCNQVGGIYTVLRSKVPSMINRWGNRYCLVGPYNPETAEVEFEPTPLFGPVGHAVERLRERGYRVHFGRWLVGGRPQAVLLEVESVAGGQVVLGEVRLITSSEAPG